MIAVGINTDGQGFGSGLTGNEIRISIGVSESQSIRSWSGRHCEVLSSGISVKNESIWSTGNNFGISLNEVVDDLLSGWFGKLGR